MWWRCIFTVPSVIPSRMATPLLRSPCATSSTTSHSRGVRKMLENVKSPINPPDIRVEILALRARVLELGGHVGGDIPVGIIRAVGERHVERSAGLVVVDRPDRA